MIKTAVIGVGSMGKNHARVYVEIPDSELVAVVDANKETVKNIANKYGVRGYTDYQEMLKTEKPEAVSIAVPTMWHEKVAVAALEAGAHILIEKPIASTLEEGQRIIKKAKELNRKIMVGHIVRFNPAIRELKQRMQNGELGRIFQIIARRTTPFPTRVQDVGVVIDLAPHDLDLMRFLTGMNPVSVYAETQQRIHSKNEDLVFGMLRFPDNVIGALEINWLTPTVVREITVLGEKGMFRVDDLTQSLYYYENGQVGGDMWSPVRFLQGVTEGPMTRYALKRYEPLKAELEAFLLAIQNNQSVPVSGEDGLEALRLALAMLDSAKSHQIVNL
jgi:UDP-N-acetylglucosamine 3-dehydrogenase